MDTETLLLKLISNEIFGHTLPHIDGYDENSLYSLAKHQDLVTIAYNALLRNDLLPSNEEIRSKFENEAMINILRVTQLNGMLSKIKDVFNENSVDFIPLKGSLLRKLYPDPVQRVSADVDVLVRDCDVERAVDLLCENGFEGNKQRTDHDVQLRYGHWHLELHFLLKRDHSGLDSILEHAWDYAVQVDRHEYEFTHEFFAFYHIAHLSKHFSHGGCGIRPLIDLQIMRKKEYYREDILKGYLSDAGFMTFYDCLIRVCDYWFDNAEADEDTLKVSDYILHGGIYGTHDTSARASISRNGKLAAILKMTFLKPVNMKYLYPVLRKHEWLLPFAYVYRIITKLFTPNGKNARRIVTTYMNQNIDDVQDIRTVFDIVQIDG